MGRCEFVDKLEGRWKLGNFVCVGLDPDVAKIPQVLKDTASSVGDLIFRFNQGIIESTHDLVVAYKPNAAFYEREGAQGLDALARTVKYIRTNYSDIPVIYDAKRADIGRTNEGYAVVAFDELGADAMTVHPYFGREAMLPILSRKDKGVIVLVRTSNPGAGEFQDLPVGVAQEPLYRVVARNVANLWNTNGNCAVVVGATYPKELAEVRGIVGDMPILIPGIGTQGGDVEAAVKAGRDSRNLGIIINSSSGIIFASKGPGFAEAARQATEQLRLEINKFRTNL